MRIRDELEQYSQALEGGQVRSLKLMCYFEGDAWAPVEVVVYPEFRSPAKANDAPQS